MGASPANLGIFMNRNIHRLICIVCFCTATATANPLLIPQELIGRHHGAIGQFGQAMKDKPLSFGEDDITLGGIELKADGGLVVPFALRGELFKDLSFKFHENHVSGAIAVWQPLQDGNDRYSATLSRYGSVFRVLVKLHREDGSVAAIQWICAEPRKAAEQTGTGQPATRPESKSEGGVNP
jgi:hypothetical protein